MTHPSRRHLLGAAAACLAAGRIRPAIAQGSEQQLTVDRARITVLEFRKDPNFAGLPAYVQNAYGVLIFPDLLKAGFLIGAEYGNGVMLTREIRSGGFGAPAFFTMAGGSFGLQIGGKVSEVILTVMNDGAVGRILSSQFKVGTDASAAAGPVGVGVGASITTQLGEDLYTFTRGQGLYGGLSLDGTGIVAKPEWNKAYYGRAVTPAQILRERSVAAPGAEGLREALAGF